MLRRAVVVLAALLAPVLVAPNAGAAPVAGSVVTERALVNWVNASRARARAPRLVVRADLTYHARRQAASMARAGRLSHTPGFGSRIRGWSYLGENVGYAWSAKSSHAGYMNSAPHRRNVLDRRFRQIGVGAAWRGDRVYTVEIFRRP